MTEDNKNNSSNDWKKRDIGAFWRRQGKNGKSFLSGKITIGEFGEEKTISIVVFPNNFKEKDNQPDFRIYEDTPMEKPSSSTPEKVDKTPEPSPESHDEDLPDMLQ